MANTTLYLILAPQSHSPNLTTTWTTQGLAHCRHSAYKERWTNMEQCEEYLVSSNRIQKKENSKIRIQFLKAPSWSPCAMWLPPTSYLFYIWSCTYVHATLSLCPSLPFPLPMSSSPGGIGRVGGRRKREEIWGYMYMYSWFTLL